MQSLYIAGLLLCVLAGRCFGRGPHVSVDMGKPSIGALPHFWTNTGLCPPAPRELAADFLLSADERLNLALIAALPADAIHHVRIHWLLELISVYPEEDLKYNWTALDDLMDWLLSHGLSPSFELMGNPSGLFTDFRNETQVQWWRTLVSRLAIRYAERYGAEAVSDWRFETWNEPDVKGYNILNLTLPGYIKYFHASADGLRDAEKWHGNGLRLRLGAPAGLFKSFNKHPLCWGLLEHCANSHCPLQFLSFHRKGNGSGLEVVHKGIKLAYRIYNSFPGLSGVPMVNNEADMMAGWSLPEPWRGDVRYAAMVASVVTYHHKLMVHNAHIPLEAISNDNAFINYHPYYFCQRTLLARFQMNNTKPPHIQFFWKPVYVVMGLMAFLGDQELHVSVHNWNHRLLTVLAASSNTHSQKFSPESWNAAVMLTFSRGTEEDLHTVTNVTVHVKNIPFGNGNPPLYTAWLLDNVHTNPYSVWRKGGAPPFPRRKLRRQMRAAQGPLRLHSLQPVPGSRRLKLMFSLTLPSVILLHFCERPEAPPGKVTNLEVIPITVGEVLLIWSDSRVGCRCIQTYEVEFSRRGNFRQAPFRRINHGDVIFLSYHYVASAASGGVNGAYRVRAVDYWGRPGPYSSQWLFPSHNP